MDGDWDVDEDGEESWLSALVVWIWLQTDKENPEIRLPGKLSGKSMRKVETVIECHYNTGWVRMTGQPPPRPANSVFFSLS